MSGNGHQTPAQVRSKLNHPVVDADGHWLEYGPVFAEQMRKVGSALAADAFLASQQTTKDNLNTSVDERRRRRIGMKGSGRERRGTRVTERPECSRASSTSGSRSSASISR